MSAPRTRLDEAATEFERELLGSWQAEAPAAHTRQKALALVGTVAVGATSTTAAATGAVGGAFVQAAAPKVATVGVVAVAKWVAAGTLLAAGVVSVAPFVGTGGPAHLPSAAPVVLERPATTPKTTGGGGPVEVFLAAGSGLAPSTSATPEVAAPEPVAASEAPPPPASPPAAEVARARAPANVARQPVAAKAAPAPESAPPPAPAEPHPLRALGDQVASLDRARSALAGGDAAQAVHAIDDYDARFPNGALAQEAAVVRIDALVKLGRGAEAADLGQRFIASHPSSPYAAKVRQSLAEVAPGRSSP